MYMHRSDTLAGHKTGVARPAGGTVRMRSTAWSGSVPIRRNPFHRNPIRRNANPNPNPKP